MRRLLTRIIPLLSVAGLAACGSDVTSSTSSASSLTTALTTTIPSTTGVTTTLLTTTSAVTTQLPTTVPASDAAIVVRTPRDGDSWVDPMMVAGTADTFEATVNYQVIAADGTVVEEGVTMATCGTGCRGVFAQELRPLPAGTATPVTIRVFDISEADGTTILDLVEVVVG